ncbi:MAG: PstS family phosphate ABC transporter substrate-binding protein, partial [Nitrospiraceae bacterium]
MVKSRKAGLLISALGGLVLLMAWGTAVAEHGPSGKPALDPALAKYVPSIQVSGSLKIAGSNTMLPLVSRLASEFRRRHPDAVIRVEGGGSSTAVKEFVNASNSSKPSHQGLMVASSRRLSETEVKQFTAKHGYEPQAVPVAVDAVGVYVHRDNPLPSLTLDQVDAVFSITRHRGYPSGIMRWNQLGLDNGWSNAPITLYGRDQKSGTRAFLREHVLENGEFVSDIREEPGAASVILALSRDPLGMGYSGIGLQASTVRAVPLADTEGMPFVEPSAESVMNGSYPLRRLLYLYVDKSPTGTLSPVVQEFLTFANSREGQETAVKTGF